ncbi:MAG TPA: BTAD domain-containing putative transcriptional regulator [Streptosporangiaceae bacterium]|nr:BTAD domain-containing putative transcriptional regulator [Streptosporangiaceae bacterium]
MTQVTFGLIGPLEIRCGDLAIVVPAPRQRSLLAALLLHANQPVAKHSLCDAVWAEYKSDQAETTLRSYVMRLRRVLGPALADRLCVRPPGYLLRIEQDDELDVLRLQGCVRRGASAAQRGDWDRSLQEFRSAVALWRGEPLCDVPSDALHMSITPTLNELRMQVWEGLFAAATHCGRTAELVVPLQHLTEEEPLSERFSALFMSALAKCNRRIDALAEFRRLRKALVAEQGVEPSMDLRELHQRLLREDELTSAGEGAKRAPALAAALPPPRQLPRGACDFAGRGQEISDLVNYLAAGIDGHVRSPVVAISGMPGIGKSELAVQTAHQLAGRYPDGQLYANLRGSRPDAVRPDDLVSRFLRALGYDRRAMAGGRLERASQYRSAMAARRTLIVLDDAGDADQVQPLIPGAGSCGTLITSRRHLGDLPEARTTTLAELDNSDALEFLAAMVGAERLADDPESVAAIVSACGGVPLALRIAGTRLVSRPGWTVAHLALLLADERHRLDELTYGRASVRAGLNAAYRALSGSSRAADVSAARSFAFLGRWHGEHITAAEAAALFGQPLPGATGDLETLVDAGLLESAAPGCYRINELTRLFATECAVTDRGAGARCRLC